MPIIVQIIIENQIIIIRGRVRYTNIIAPTGGMPRRTDVTPILKQIMSADCTAVLLLMTLLLLQQLRALVHRV